MNHHGFLALPKEDVIRLGDVLQQADLAKGDPFPLQQRVVVSRKSLRKLYSCPLRESNARPSPYEGDALPLS
jgi:hypothetical protein